MDSGVASPVGGDRMTAFANSVEAGNSFVVFEIPMLRMGGGGVCLNTPSAFFADNGKGALLRLFSNLRHSVKFYLIIIQGQVIR